MEETKKDKIKYYIVYRPNSVLRRYTLITPIRWSEDLLLAQEKMYAEDLKTIYDRYPEARNYPIVDFNEYTKNHDYLW